jgi:hypothetical protein
MVRKTRNPDASFLAVSFLLEVKPKTEALAALLTGVWAPLGRRSAPLQAVCHPLQR